MTERDSSYDYSYQDLDESNLRDLLPSIAANDFVGIVSEKTGGIVAYAHQEHAIEITATLNAYARLSKPEPEPEYVPVQRKILVRVTDTKIYERTFDSDELFDLYFEKRGLSREEFDNMTPSDVAAELNEEGTGWLTHPVNDTGSTETEIDTEFKENRA